VPAQVRAAWDARERGAQAQQAWQARFDAYRAAHPDAAAEFERRMAGRLTGELDDALDRAVARATESAAAVATRKASQLALDQIGPALPELIGGSADLTGSNLTDFTGIGALRVGEAGPVGGRHINYGVREFGMAAIMNGIALHGGFVPYGGTFLTFSDYSRNAIRMAALMKQRVVHVFTHDSIGLGEDGPTHQPVEHAASLRLIPGLDVWRPADAVETALAWGCAIERADGPSALLLTRQAVPHVSRSEAQIAGIRRGGYVLRDAGEARAVLIATGSELSLALGARDQLAERGIEVRVVSMPSTSVFDRQDVTYRSYVLSENLPRIAVEAGVTDGWWKYRCAAVVGIDSFGESAPAAALFEHFGLTVTRVVDAVLAAIERRGR